VSEFHAVITGNYRAAVEDWRDRMKSFDPSRMKGVLHDGTLVIFVAVDRSDRLRGLELSGYDIHRTAYLGRYGALEECESVAKSRIRKATP